MALRRGQGAGTRAAAALNRGCPTRDLRFTIDDTVMACRSPCMLKIHTGTRPEAQSIVFLWQRHAPAPCTSRFPHNCFGLRQTEIITPVGAVARGSRFCDFDAARPAEFGSCSLTGSHSSRISYAELACPAGLPQAFTIAEFPAGAPSCLVRRQSFLRRRSGEICTATTARATIFAYRWRRSYGWLAWMRGRCANLGGERRERPGYAVPPFTSSTSGLGVAASLKHSARGERRF
jgi:hypothetical protein